MNMNDRLVVFADRAIIFLLSACATFLSSQKIVQNRIEIGIANFEFIGPRFGFSFRVEVGEGEPGMTVVALRIGWPASRRRAMRVSFGVFWIRSRQVSQVSMCVATASASANSSL